MRFSLTVISKLRLALLIASFVAVGCDSVWEPPNPCPSIPELTPAQAEELRVLVESLETNFESEVREEPWASTKEEGIRAGYSTLEHDPVGNVDVDSVECRSSRCVVRMLYMVDVSDQTWAGDDLGNGLIGALARYMTKSEPCEFHIPGVYTVTERSCGVFEHRVYVRCER
jgi:hypothetical protein